MERRFLRFESSGKPCWGECLGSVVHELSSAPWLPDSKRTGREFSRDGVKLLPCGEPSKILALGYNYKDLFTDKAAMSRSGEKHYTEEGFEPMLFLKSPNALSAHDGIVRVPANAAEVWVEVELAVVVGRDLPVGASLPECEKAIFGYTIGNDVSALNIGGRDWHLARSKSRDGFCPLGPELVTGFRPEGRLLTSRVNGETRQSSSTDQMVYGSARSVAFVASMMSLSAGDVILTGTPLGARQSLVKPGDSVEMEIDGLGVLRTRFVEDK